MGNKSIDSGVAANAVVVEWLPVCPVDGYDLIHTTRAQER
jgi:hypothetical protein